MKKRFDYVIVGAGLFGSIFAREMTDAGAKVLVLEKRPHIGGNCRTENREGINVHMYGAHIFHTNSLYIWEYMNKWTTFRDYRHRLKAFSNDRIWSFPINLDTINEVWGISNPIQAKIKIESVRLPIENPSNLEDWVLSQIGDELYKLFYRDYSIKQWAKDPKLIPAAISKRLPIRLNYNNNYYDDKYQGIPEGGYTKIFEQLLLDIPLETSVDFNSDRDRFESMGTKIVYTGGLDELFSYELGYLDWRSLRFEHEHKSEYDHQGISVINYCDNSVPWTRVLEHKHFEWVDTNSTIITREFPCNWKLGDDKYYPVNDEVNTYLYKKYKSLLPENYIIGGRLADYKYYDMHHVVGSALSRVKEELDQNGSIRLSER